MKASLYGKVRPSIEIGNNIASIQVLKDEIVLKASQGDLDTLTGRVTTAEASITTNAESISLKADQTIVTGIDTRLQTAEQKITAEAITSTVRSSTDYTADQNRLKNYVKSRGQNLVTNGTGLLDDNTNFSNFTFDKYDGYNTTGSFTNSTYHASVYSDELIPVNPDLTYRMKYYVKGNPYVGSRGYGMVVCYDAFGNIIVPENTMYQAGTTTTLAQELKSGDTVVYLTDASNWRNDGTAGVNTHLRALIAWNYVNPGGYAWPTHTYSRNVMLDLWDPGAVDYVNNTITLKRPWALANVPAGTEVSNGSSGSTYKYIAGSNFIIPENWEMQEGTISGVDDSGANNSAKFHPGTAAVKIGWLLNRNVSGGKSWLSNISFEIDYAGDIDAVSQRMTIAETNITQNSESISLKADQTTVTDIGTRLQTAEQKITAEAITSTVRNSTEYATDLTGKVGFTTFDYYKGQTGTSQDWKSNKSLNTGGWYRIATNPGERAFAQFTLKDTMSGQHQTAIFNTGITFGNNPTFTLTGFSSYSTTPVVDKVRIVKKGTYDPVYLEIYVKSQSILEIYCRDNVQASGWTLVDYEVGSVPTGYSTIEYPIGKEYLSDATGQNTSKDTANVAGVPSTEVKTRLETAESEIKQTADEISLRVGKAVIGEKQTFVDAVNFIDKIAGSTSENPHIGKLPYMNAVSLENPITGAFGEPSQSNYDTMNSLDGTIFARATSNNGAIAQTIFSFDLIEYVQRTYGTIPGASTADKVAWLKTNISKLMVYWWGFGSSPSGNKANLTAWDADLNTWFTTIRSHTNGSVSKLELNIISLTANIVKTVDANGFVHFLAYAEPSDGTTASVINTDYVELEVELSMNTLADRVQETESQLTVQADAITARVSKSEVNAYANSVKKVRYIRDWLNGSSANAGSHWVEIEAIAGGTNVALGKPVTSNYNDVINIERLTDGNTSTHSYVWGGIEDGNPRYLEIDLGVVRDDIEYLTVWHYYNDNRIYNDTKTEISEDGVTWVPLFDSALTGKYVETEKGHVVPVNPGKGLSDLQGRLSYAETQITADAITSTVRNSNEYTNDLAGKASPTDVTNAINNSKTTNYGYRYYKQIVVYGDSTSLYYPVLIKGGDQTVKRDILIKRGYSEQAPSDWYSSTHKGGLTLKIRTNFGGWGGATYNWEIHEFQEQYSNMFAGAQTLSPQNGFAIFLRGGGTTGAVYHLYSDQSLEASIYNSAGDVPPSPQIAYNQDKWFDYDHPNGTYYRYYAPAPRTRSAADIEEIRLKSFIDLAQETDTVVKNQQTQINQQADEINLRATKEEVANIGAEGRNLWIRKDSVEGYVTNADGTIFSADAENRVSDFIEVDITKEYVYHLRTVIKGTNSFLNSWTGIGYYDENKSFISRGVLSEAAVPVDTEVDYVYYLKSGFPENTKYIRIGSRYLKDGFAKLEKGFEPTGLSLAPEDIEERISTAEGELIVQSEAITAKVSKTDYENDILTWQQVVTVNTNTPAVLKDKAGNDIVPDYKYSYKVEGRVSPTGTNTGAIAYFKPASPSGTASFTLQKLKENGTDSNHVEFFIDGNGKPSVRLYAHASFYTVYLTITKTAGPFVEGAELDLRVKTAEQQITADAITSTVRAHDDYKGDLSNLEDSVIQQTSDSINLKVNKVLMGEKLPSTTTGDYGGKVEGSTAENPHSAYVSGSTTALKSPLVSWTEFQQGPTDYYNYDYLGGLDGEITKGVTSVTNAPSQHRFSFDMIAHVESNYQTIPGETVLEKVTWLKANITKLTVNWWGYGVGPSGNKATFTEYLHDVSMWSVQENVNYGVTHTNSTVSKLTKAITIPRSISDTGFVEVNAYAEASDGTTASNINTDYVELVVELSSNSIGDRLSTAEQKITSSAIISTVTSSQTFQDKVDQGVDNGIANIKMGVRNLVIRNDELLDQYLLNNDGTTTANVGSSVMNGKISVVPGENLYFTKTTAGDDYWRWNEFDVNETYLRRNPDNRNSFRWTVPADTYFIQVSYPTESQVKIERGDISTGWSPAPEDVNAEFSGVIGRLETAEESITEKAITATVLGATSFAEVLSGKTDVSELANYTTTEALNTAIDALEDYTDTKIGEINLSSYVSLTKLEQTEDAFDFKLTSAGGVNLLQNSVGWADDYNWTLSGSGDFEVIKGTSELIGLGSGAAWKLNLQTITQEVPVVAGEEYTFRCLVKKTAGQPGGYLKLDDGSGTMVTQLTYYTASAYDWDEFKYSFVAKGSNVKIQINNVGTGDTLITNVMLNKGALPMQWTHAKNEIHNTNVRFDLGGIVVQNNQTNGETRITPEEFAGYARKEDGSQEKIFTLNGDTTEVKKLKAEEEFAMGSIRILQIQSGAVNGWAFLPREE